MNEDMNKDMIEDEHVSLSLVRVYLLSLWRFLTAAKNSCLVLGASSHKALK